MLMNYLRSPQSKMAITQHANYSALPIVTVRISAVDIEYSMSMVSVHQQKHRLPMCTLVTAVGLSGVLENHIKSIYCQATAKHRHEMK